MSISPLHIAHLNNTDELKNDILLRLAYFSVFRHPLKACEVQNLLTNFHELEVVKYVLELLVLEGACYEKEGYYSTLKTVAINLSERQSKERIAAPFFEKIPFYGRLISSFPFVRGVAISGSLSKGLIHEDGDIDYFIITAHNRLWITRVLLVLFKKIFLFNSHKYFCVNYFVSESALEIPDKNLFTATEISTLIPIYGIEKVEEFFSANAWVKEYMGHFKHPINIAPVAPKGPRWKKFQERVLGGWFGSMLDKVGMRITVWQWRRKFKAFSNEKFDLTMRSTRNVSKHHPQDFQSRVLEEVDDRLNEIKLRLNNAT